MENQKKSEKSAKAWYRDEEKNEYLPFEEGYEERRGKRPEVLTDSVNFRLAPDAKKVLQDIADYEYCYKISELVRGWVLDQIKVYQRNPRFKEYLKKREEWLRRTKGDLKREWEKNE